MSQPEISILSDVQFAALLSALVTFFGGLLATIKWAVTRIVKAIDDAATADKSAAEKFTRLETKIDEVHSWVHRHTPPTGLRVITSSDGHG